MSEKGSRNRVGAGWLRSGKTGKFLSITLELDGTRRDFVMFKNDRKTNDRAPDYVVYESNRVPNGQNDQRRSGNVGYTTGVKKQVVSAKPQQQELDSVEVESTEDW